MSEVRRLSRYSTMRSEDGEQVLMATSACRINSLDSMLSGSIGSY